MNRTLLYLSVAYFFNVQGIDTRYGFKELPSLNFFQDRFSEDFLTIPQQSCGLDRILDSTKPWEKFIKLENSLKQNCYIDKQSIAQTKRYHNRDYRLRGKFPSKKDNKEKLNFSNRERSYFIASSDLSAKRKHSSLFK